MPARPTSRDPIKITQREITLWVKMLRPLPKLIESMGGTLHVEVIFPNNYIEVWPPPQLETEGPKPEPSEAIMESPGSLEPAERGEPQSTTVVAPGENQCQRSAASLSGQPQEQDPYPSTSDILRMWREASQSRT